MYTRIKALVLRLIPGGLLFRAEPLLRGIYTLLYRGRKFRCNVCGRGLRKFIRLPDGDALCPNCGSLSRNRRLWDLLETEYLKEGLSLLDFSPSRCLYRRLKSLPSISYTATDLSGFFLADRAWDITRIDAGDDTFNLVICYHVLEHVEDDQRGMRELYRILKQGGVCLVQSPFREGRICEDPSVVTAKARAEHFGQEDHVRIYSVEGLAARLSKAGFEVRAREFSPEGKEEYGFKGGETILVCTKQVSLKRQH